MHDAIRFGSLLVDVEGIKTDFLLTSKIGDKVTVEVTGITLVFPEPAGPTNIRPCLTTVVSYN